MRILFLFGMLLLISTSVYAQNQTGQVDWDKIENTVWQNMEAEGQPKAMFHQAMGYSYISEEFGNQTDKAIFHFKKAVELDSTLYLSWYNLGIQFIDTEEGNEYFRKAIETNPNYSPPYYWLGYVYCRHKRDKEAIPIFEKYLKVAKGDLNETQRISTATKLITELRSGKDGEALKMLRQ